MFKEPIKDNESENTYSEIESENKSIGSDSSSQVEQLQRVVSFSNHDFVYEIPKRVSSVSKLQPRVMPGCTPEDTTQFIPAYLAKDISTVFFGYIVERKHEHTNILDEYLLEEFNSESEIDLINFDDDFEFKKIHDPYVYLVDKGTKIWIVDSRTEISTLYNSSSSPSISSQEYEVTSSSCSHGPHHKQPTLLGINKNTSKECRAVVSSTRNISDVITDWKTDKRYSDNLKIDKMQSNKHGHYLKNEICNKDKHLEIENLKTENICEWRNINKNGSEKTNLDTIYVSIVGTLGKNKPKNENQTPIITVKRGNLIGTHSIRNNQLSGDFHFYFDRALERFIESWLEERRTAFT